MLAVLSEVVKEMKTRVELRTVHAEALLTILSEAAEEMKKLVELRLVLAEVLGRQKPQMALFLLSSFQKVVGRMRKLASVLVPLTPWEMVWRTKTQMAWW